MKISIAFFLIISALILMDASAVMADTPMVYHYNPNLVDVSGRVIYQKFYDQGPPYWGENKLPSGKAIILPKVDILVLRLDRPIDVVATEHSGPNQDSFKDIRIIEIETPDKHMERYLGRHVKIVGLLFERTTGFEYTDVLLYVKSATPSPR